MIGLPAGLQPRAAVGYGFGVAAEVAAHCGVAPSIRTEIDAAAAHLEAQQRRADGARGGARRRDRGQRAR